MHPPQNSPLFGHYRPKITEALLGFNEVPVGRKVSKKLQEIPELFFISDDRIVLTDDPQNIPSLAWQCFTPNALL